jgi:hypothetical protein
VDVSDADRVEELTELASTFLSDLGGERGLVVHGNEESATPVIQTFFGLGSDEIYVLMLHFNEIADRYVGVYSDEYRGRQVLMAPLRDASGDCLGWLYLDSDQVFPDEAFDSLAQFARSYLASLLEICVLRPALPRRRKPR